MVVEGKLLSDLTANQKTAIALLGAEHVRFPQWKVAATMLWEQTFPAVREVIVEHTYTPFVGMAYNEPYQHKYVSFDIPTADREQNSPKGRL